MTRIGSYDILEPLPARFHYRARDAEGQIVALQVLPAWRHSEETLARFERELRLEKAVDHENVAAFLGSGSTTISDQELVGNDGEGEVFYIVREFVGGRTLADLIAQGPANLPLSISVAIQAGRGLGALHEAGVVHRNVRPETLALRPDGVLKLFDFGLVKILRDETSSEDAFRTGAGQVVGAAGYMAPEQLVGGTVDPRTDLFSLGCVLYELVTGRPPFPGDLIEYFRAVTAADPVPPGEARADLPASLDRIIRRLLSKDPEKRYPSAVEMEADLIESLGDPQV